MGKPVNTNEDRQRRLDELIERINRGMGIRAALADMGYTGKSAGQQYRQLRNFAKENDPVANAALPEKMDGSVVLVTSLADAMKNCQDAAETFFGECENMGLKIAKVPEAKAPGIEFRVNGIDTELGSFRYYKRSGYMDWESENDAVSLNIDEWRQLIRDLPKIMEILGVKE